MGSVNRDREARSERVGRFALASKSKTTDVIVLVVVGLLLLWLWNSIWLWPLKVLVVLFHELGHAVATWATGGEVIEIAVNPNQGGHTLSRGGWRLLILNGGYLGSLLAGLALLASARKPRTAQLTAGALALGLGLLGLWWVRPLLGFGFGFTLLAAAMLAVLARHAPLAAPALRGLGVFSVLYALFDVRDDVFHAPGDAVSDATMLAELTGIPGALWGIAWIGLGLASLWLSRRWWV